MPQFEIDEQRDQSGAVCLRLVGEFDLVVAHQLNERLEELKRSAATVKLDLSQLQFMDSTGLRVVVTAMLDAQQNGWNLEVDRRLAPPVARLLELVQADKLLWPSTARPGSS